MSLGNFFTLTELNDGLTAPSRVRELVAIMQKDRDCTMNVADAIRQWSAVARTIAATETKDCLDLFIQLDGLQFIHKWLKDVQKFSNETDDSFMEESISHLLQALQKLPVDNENLVSSNISAAVKDFLGHNSSKVLDTARALLDSWEKDLTANDTQITEMERDSRQSESSLGGALISRESTVEEKCQQSTNDHPGPPTNFSALEPDNVESAPSSDRIFDHPVMNDRTSDHVGSPSSSRHANESEPFARQGEQTVLNDLEAADDVMRITKTESSPEKVDLPDESQPSGDQPSTSEAADAQGSAMESSLQKLSDAMLKVGPKSSSSADVRTTNSDEKDAVDGGGLSVQRRNSDAQTKENAELDTILRNSTTSEKSWENLKNSSTLFKVEDEGGTKKIDRHDRDGSKSRATDYKFGKSKIDRKPDVTNKKSMVELDYGILDPLEVARQVAMEVRDLVDFREQSCSSSEKSPAGKYHEPDSPEISSGKGSHASEGSPKETANDTDMSTEASPMREESTSGSENLGAAEPINNAQDVETSQVTEVAQEEANMTKGLCNFDLNQEVHSEDTNFPVNQISTTVSTVSASRATAASGFPVAPLQFEGMFGWKGSAATSAFRPASPRRISEGDKDLSTGESSSNSKQRQGCLDIDLNIAESEDGRFEDLPNKEVPVSSTIISGESLVDANSRSERIDLDLNRASEDGDVPSEWQINGQLFPKRNNHQSQTLSSSSSLKQPSLRNIDLNDQPSFLNDNSDHSHLTNLPRNLNVPGELESDESVISIMGTRVEVKRRDVVPHILPLPNGSNGKTPELAFDVNLSSRTGSFLGMGSAPPYPQSTLYNFNGISPGHTLPYPTLYATAGPIPYMVDSRGAPVVPHIVGSTSALPPAFSQPPFLVGMTSSTLSNGVMPSQGSFDLDSRLMLEGTSRGPSGMGLVPNSGPFMSADEHLRYYSQPSISSVGEKRKEPDGGWDYYLKYYNSHGRPFLG